jgi:hypothetical protein
LVGRGAVKGRAIDGEARSLVLAKDALLAAATGIASVINGLRLTHQAPEGATPIDSGLTPAPEMSEEAAGLLRVVNLLGDEHPLLGSVIAASTILYEGQRVRKLGCGVSPPALESQANAPSWPATSAASAIDALYFENIRALGDLTE